MKTAKRKFMVDTHDWGVFYRYAKSAQAALNRVVYAVFGPSYNGWAHDYWEVTEVTQGQGGAT